MQALGSRSRTQSRVLLRGRGDGRFDSVSTRRLGLERQLFPGRFWIQVPRQLHGVVQHPADHQQGSLNAVDQKVAGPADHPRTGAQVMPAQSQMPRTNSRPEFWAHEAARTVGLCRHVAKCRDDQALIAQPRCLAELLLRPGQDVDDIGLCCVRQAIAQAQPAVLPCRAARRPNCAMKSSS